MKKKDWMILSFALLTQVNLYGQTSTQSNLNSEEKIVKKNLNSPEVPVNSEIIKPDNLHGVKPKNQLEVSNSNGKSKKIELTDVQVRICLELGLDPEKTSYSELKEKLRKLQEDSPEKFNALVTKVKSSENNKIKISREEYDKLPDHRKEYINSNQEQFQIVNNF